ncbi:MAG TPA: universal stress protein [Methylomirabilota bacterium]|jgi:nucleotide-binding universal stress UspA family protein
MTIKTILLAVDRSPRAAAEADLVANTARGAHATVRLLHVMAEGEAALDATGRVVVYADQETASRTSEGLNYLRTLAPHFDGVPLECNVRFGDPVGQILEEADEVGADLIVVGTAGRSGIGRVLLGSVAERVFARAAVPVLLVRPTPEPPERGATARPGSSTGPR